MYTNYKIYKFQQKFMIHSTFRDENMDLTPMILLLHFSVKVRADYVLGVFVWAFKVVF